jgi:hypothetical protein
MLQIRQTYACPKNIMKWRSRDQVWDKNQGLQTLRQNHNGLRCMIFPKKNIQDGGFI